MRYIVKEERDVGEGGLSQSSLTLFVVIGFVVEIVLDGNSILGKLYQWHHKLLTNAPIFKNGHFLERIGQCHFDFIKTFSKKKLIA